MKDFVEQYFIVFGGVWAFSLITGIWVKALNDKIIYTKDVAFALLFGPIWWCFQVMDWNTVLWRQKEKN